MSNELAKKAFDAAFERMAPGKSETAAPFMPLSAADETIDRLIAQFEAIGQVDDDGHEYWLARDLRRFLGMPNGITSRLPSARRRKLAPWLALVGTTILPASGRWAAAQSATSMTSFATGRPAV